MKSERSVEIDLWQRLEGKRYDILAIASMGMVIISGVVILLTVLVMIA